VLIEKYLPNKIDVNCAAYLLHGEIVVSEPETAFGDGIYTFRDKYEKANHANAESIGKKCPNSQNQGGRYALSGTLRDKIRSYTRTVYKRMHMQGVVRMDFLVGGGNVYLCEVNTVPGSLAYYLFCERLIDARAFLGDILEEALAADSKGEKEILHTGILNSVRKNK
jgi:D-alanine-D-alanine ligase